MNKALKIAAIGECMIELRQGDAPAQFEMGYSGDSANSAIYLARAVRDLNHIQIDYISAVGSDPYSQQLVDFLKSESVGTSMIGRIPDRQAGLYIIRTDDHGERSFYYYRSQSAARVMFQGQAGQTLLAQLKAYDYLYFTGISLSILDEAQQQSLLSHLHDAKQAGAKLVFDGNYRPRGWQDETHARLVFKQFLPLCDMALMTFEDEQMLHGDEQPQQAIDRLRRFGIQQGVIKLGRDGAILFDSDSSQHIHPQTIIDRPVDTTAAGDSFNAAFLGALLSGQSPLEAVNAANQLAAQVICHKGAIMPFFNDDV